MSVSPSSRHHVSSWRRTLETSTRSGLPQVLLLGALLLTRVLTDDLSASDSRQSGSLNLSAAIAVVFAIWAVVILLRQRRGLRVTALTTVWLLIWTGVAVSTHGTSSETLREGVREGSVVALAAVVFNAYEVMTPAITTRIVQLIGVVPAVLAVYQVATHTGMLVAGNIRSHGTFAHPNSAAMYFAIAGTVSLWRYLDMGRHSYDAILTTLFAAALIATFSIDGLVTLFAMLIALGALRPGSLGAKFAPWAIAVAVVLAFFATPLGGSRIVKQSSTNLATAERGEANTTLGWRLNKWKTLLPAWEGAPLFGQGLGTTITEERAASNEYAGDPPHNEYVRYLVETGIVGLSLALFGLSALIRSLIRRRRAFQMPGDDAIGLPTLAIVIVFGCLVNALADNTFLNSPTCYAAALIVVPVLSSAPARPSRSSTTRAA